MPPFLSLTLQHTPKTERKKEKEFNLSQYLSPFLKVDLWWKQKDMNDFNPQKQWVTCPDDLEQYKYMKWQIFLLCLSVPSSQILRETHTCAPTTHSIMYNEISPSLYLRAAVPMINAPLAGKLCCWRKTGREQDTWNISLGPFLIIIIIIISALLPYLSC